MVKEGDIPGIGVRFGNYDGSGGRSSEPRYGLLRFAQEGMCAESYDSGLHKQYSNVHGHILDNLDKMEIDLPGKLC